ncbi:MAG: hypothetical protein AVO33_00180 [delta proteobacterium ML8_F1]|nr:MAG: hypothetical protein AVO33_00180 [delta proteobacterium ML8_F1]
MNFLKSFKNHKLQIFALILFTAVWLFLLWGNYSDYQLQKQTFLEEEREEIENRIESIIITYDLFTSFIYDGIIADPNITRLMKEACGDGVPLQEDCRNTLYEALHPFYESLESHGFRQLHFHKPDGESFLRFHAPLKYADPLFDIRESVRIANTELKKVVGFEEGRIFSGYRFVFPLFHKEEHVGSVEVSVGLDTVLELLERMYLDLGIFYLIEKDEVTEKVFDDQLDNYLPYKDFEGYLIDRAMAEMIQADTESFAIFENPAALEKIREALGTEEEKPVSLVVNVQGEAHQIHLIPLVNILQEPVGVFIATKELPVAFLSARQPLRELVLTTLIYLLILTIALVVTRDKERLKILASVDQLTGIFNRHKLTELSEREFQRSQRTRRGFCALMVDIDHFKTINDTFGHAEGDRILRKIGGLFTQTLRAVDIYGRWGGEEFLIIAPETDAEKALILASRLNDAIATLETPSQNPITVSIGIAETSQEDTGIDQVIQRADQALYTAKKTGRNKVVLWSPE